MCYKVTAWAKSMCGWCFNINVTAPTTAFCSAWYVEHLCYLAAATHSTVSVFTYVAKILSSFLAAGTDLNVCTHKCVSILHVNFPSLMQHAPLHITYQRHFSIQQGHSAHTWMHAGIYCVGSKYLHLVSARFVSYEPLSHMPCNLWMLQQLYILEFKLLRQWGGNISGYLSQLQLDQMHQHSREKHAILLGVPNVLYVGLTQSKQFNHKETVGFYVIVGRSNIWKLMPNRAAFSSCVVRKLKRQTIHEHWRCHENDVNLIFSCINKRLSKYIWITFSCITTQR